MSFERSLARSKPILPRFRSVSSHRRPCLSTMPRSRSQPSQKIVYSGGTVSKFLAHSRPAHSPSPVRVYVFSPGNPILTRISHSGSHNDLYSSHVYSTLEPIIKESKHQAVELDVRVTSCDDIYHKGPFFPDVTQSESGVSLGESEDSSLFGGDDDNASQISFGSSSAFHEITIDSELDRLDREDLLKSPHDPSFWHRSRRPFSPGSDPRSPSPYADSKKRELLKSPSWESDKTLSKHLRVLIPAPDGSLAKERLTRRDSGPTSRPLAQSSPHESPRSFMGPRLSIAGCWNADDPYDGDESHNDSTATKKIDDSSCYSSLSEDNLSDVSPAKSNSTRKVKLTKKASNVRTKKSTSQSLSQSNGPKDESPVPEESLENIYIPPLESVISGDMMGLSGNSDTEGGASWWAVYNIGTADARQEEREQQEGSPTEGGNLSPKVKIVKAAKTGIPLISAGKYGKEKLKRYSQSSPPPANSITSPKSSSPSPSDHSDDNLFDDTIEMDKSGEKGDERLKRDCKERLEDVLTETTQNLHLNKMGAFDIVRASGNERDSQTSASLDALRNGMRSVENNELITNNQSEISINAGSGEINAHDKGEQLMIDKPVADSITSGNLPYNFNSSPTNEEKIKNGVELKQHCDETIIDNNFFQVSPSQMTIEVPQSSVILNHTDNQSLHLDPNEQRREWLSKQIPPIGNAVDYEDDGSDSPEETDCRHYGLGNWDAEGQLVEPQAAFSTLHLPGEVKTQVVEQRIVDVGGLRRGVDTTVIQEESSLTSYTPGIREDKNNGLTSHFSASHASSQTPTQHADGNVRLPDVNSTDLRAKEFDDLCSQFSTALNICDFDETLVNDGESDLSTDSQTGSGNQVHVFSLEPKVENYCEEKVNQLIESNNRIIDPLETDETSLSRQIFEEKVSRNDPIEIISGNIGFKEPEPSDTSSGKSGVEISTDPDQAEAESSMEWRFIDPKLLHAGGKSHWEEGRGFEEEAMDEEFDSPFVVRIMATAELPQNQTEETQLTYTSPIKLFQPGDSFINNEPPYYINSSHQSDFANIQYQQCNPQLAKELINDNSYHDSNQNNVTKRNGDMRFKTRQSWENLNGKADPQGSIRYQSEEGDLREDKGIPREKKSDAQNGASASRQEGDEHEFSSSHSYSGPVTESKGDAPSTTLSQQVKHVHRKIVEETVTIERSSTCDFSGDLSAYNRINGDDFNCVEIKNRRETVIQEEDEIFTITGPVSNVISPKLEENVSSEALSLSIEPNFSACDLTHSTHHSSFDQKDPVPQNTSFLSTPIVKAETNDVLNASALPPDNLTTTFNPAYDESHASTMKWRDNSTIPSTYISFDPNFDPPNRVIDVQDNPMVTEAEHGIMKHVVSTPVTHHSPLDQLQAQLSQISGVGFDVPTTTVLPGNVYHDHGEATTHDWKISNEVSPPVSAIDKETGKCRVEIYDNDYDYTTSNQSKEQSLNPTPVRHHQLLKSGHMKTSSLWTLQEETDSLLEGVSPISSPKREFSTINVEERDECFVNETKPQNNVNLSDNQVEKGDFNSSFHSSISAFGQRKFGSESSDVDESDGNYSSISTADSFRSSSFGREQTPLSDSDFGVPGDLGADKIDYDGRTIQTVAPGYASISSFHDFVTGLESEPLTSDRTVKSLATVSNNGLNQQGPINFGESQDALPTTFKSSVAFCVSAAQEASARELSHEDNNESTNCPSILSSDNSTMSSSTFSFKKPFLSTHRYAGIPAFPVEEDSLSSFSMQFTNDDTNSETSYGQSEASSRLHVLDLDLSRISSCASPTPSDFSDGSMFTCKGTAEIKKGPSVSFEDDYEMVPSPTRHIPSSTPRPLKSALKKSVNIENNHRHIIKDTAHSVWVEQFDKILDDFNNKTHRLGPESEVLVMEDKHPEGSTLSHGPNNNELYKAFTNEDSEKKQNNVCPIVEDDSMSTFRFKRFLKKSHTKRSKGRRLIRFFSRLSCVSESVCSPDLSATRKMAKLDNGQAYGTDFVPPPPERVHQPLTANSSTFQRHFVFDNTKDSPTSSNHSLDSCPSRTDSAYSSVSESFSGTFNSPKHSSRLPTNSLNSTSNSDSFYLDSVSSSTSDYVRSSVTSDPFSPHTPHEKSQEMLTALSDVLNQLDVCGGEIDTALLDRLQYGHQAYHSDRHT